MENNKNFVLAIVLSLAVLIGWQLLFVRPAEQARRQQTLEQRKAADGSREAQGGTAQPPVPDATPQASLAPPLALVYSTRDAAIAASPRIKVEGPAFRGSINLKGGRLDDLVLKNYTITTDPQSEKVVLLSPSGSKTPFYATLGFLPSGGGTKLPGDDTVWAQEGAGDLTPSAPVTLKYDNGAGVTFRRTIAIDDHYMFTVADEVDNQSGQGISLAPFGQVARLTEPETSGYSVLHEGLVGILGKTGLEEVTYSSALKRFDAAATPVTEPIPGDGGWLGFTDQYWAAVLIPDQAKSYSARMFGNERKQFYVDYLQQPISIAAGEKQQIQQRVFAGAKEVGLLRQYRDELHIDRFDKLIDWGWFPFLTQPMFYLLDFFYKLVGNFGVAILLSTVLVKLLFFPLSNKSYASMNKMKLLQPEMKRLQERFKDDRAKQQQAVMELYRKEKVSPVSGCLPVLIQAPVFFALYKVLLVTIEMRHAPFVGWVRDLSAPDTTTIFNLFGLIPWTPPHALMLGALPIFMGFTQWIQMRLQPKPADPMQAQLMTVLPFVFTYMLAHFPAGLVIYWTWNNLLSFAQQTIMMKRHGSDVDVTQNLGLKKLQQLPQRFKDTRTRRPAE